MSQGSCNTFGSGSRLTVRLPCPPLSPRVVSDLLFICGRVGTLICPWATGYDMVIVLLCLNAS